MNKYYVDLNVIYALFDYLAPSPLTDMKKRREAILEFIVNNNNIKFIISKTVYIEWFQKILNHKRGDMKFNQFKKTISYKEIIDKFKKNFTRIKKDDSIFEFEWEYEEFIEPAKDTWDHFHNTMKQNNYQYLTFDKKFSPEKSDFLYIKR